MRERGKEPKRERSLPATTDVVIGVLDEQPDATTVEIATAVGLGRSTVSAALARLESAGKVKRRAGGREGARRLPDRWRRSRRRACVGLAQPGEARTRVSLTASCMACRSGTCVAGRQDFVCSEA
jgi:DNA-binding transcriptional ArsR family regulator